MHVSLHRAPSFAAGWEGVLMPWFETANAAVLESHAAIAVVVPFRNHAYALRRKLFASGRSLLGVRFMVAMELREFLRTDETPLVPLRENLRLFLSSAAAECATEFHNAERIQDSQVASAVAREPDGLLRAIDSVTAAGATFAELSSPALAKIATRFKRILEQCGCVLVSESDRLLAESAGVGQPRFSKLLITGFDGAHWPLWPLLSAAVCTTEDATVLLVEPRHEAAEADRIWLSTWEETFGAAQQVGPKLEDLDLPFARLQTLPETRSETAARKSEPLSNVHFMLGHGTTEQAQAIVSLGVGFMAEKSGTVGILLPGRSALARLVASELQKFGIAHNDAIAHQMRGAFDTEEWRAWLELQERPQLEPLLRFLEHSRVATEVFAPLSLRKIKSTLSRACGDILINAVDVLREYCQCKNDDVDHQQIAKALQEIRFFPETATFKEFLGATEEVFRTFKWSERAAEINRLTQDWSERFMQRLSRQDFLRWLTEIFAESSIARDACGDHPYARLQLLSYDEAEFGSWSHVIFAGLNEGVWPPWADESPFLPDETIVAMNRKNTCESERFGVGQQIVRNGTTLCLSALQRRKFALRQLLNVIDSTTQAIGVSAERYTQSTREQAVNPSEFFARLYFSARGEALSQDKIAIIHKQTQRWLIETNLFESHKSSTDAVEQTEIAYAARRRSDVDFSVYEFAFPRESPPPEQISLSATDIANLVQRPALVWMKVFLGVASEELDAGSWSLATGQWVHRWLASIGAPGENSFVPAQSSDEMIGRVIGAADEFRAGVLRMLTAAGRTREPDWWQSGWRNARYLAEQFAAQVAAKRDWPRLATEWQLDRPHLIQLDPDHELRVRGRLDLVLAPDQRPTQIWIVDYKTGQAEPLRSKPDKFRRQLLAGNGVQICIYALALRDDFKEICVSLLARNAELEPQATLEEISLENEFWKEIARMQQTGIFGMLGEIRSEFAFTGTYPLATLSIDKFLLLDKWQRTHPAFAKADKK